MFTKLLEFLKLLRSFFARLFARLFGRRTSDVDDGVDDGVGGEVDEEVDEEVDDGADDAPLVQVEIRNRTSLTLRIDGIDGIEGIDAPDGVVLRRGEVAHTAIRRGAVTSVADEVTGVVVASLTVDDDTDVGRGDGATVLVIDHSGLSLPPAPDPGARVTARFRNRTPFDLRIVDVDGGVEEMCPRQHTITVDSAPHRFVRVVTDSSQSAARRTAGAGEVPDGLELGRFVIGAAPVTHEIENTVIGLENTTGGPLSCQRIGPDGDVLTYLLLPAHDYRLAENYTADVWEILFGGPVLQRVSRSWAAQHVRLDVRMFPLPVDGADARSVEVENRLPLTVDLHERGASGHWTAAGSMPPGARLTVTTSFGAVLRATERRSSVVLAERVVDQPDVTTMWLIADAPPVDHTSRVEISNETHMATWVVDLASREVQTLLPHGQVSLDKTLGSAVALAGLEPALDAQGRAAAVDGVIGIAVAERAQPVLRPTSAGLRGRSGGAPLDVVVQNLSGVPASVVDVDEHGVVREVVTCLDADESATCATFVDRIVRVVRHGTGEILFETIASAAGTDLRVVVGSRPTGPRLSAVLVNRTLLDIVLKVLDEQGRIAPATEFELGPGEVVDLPECAGWSHVVVEKRSGTIVHAFVTQRGVPVVEVTSQHLRSSFGDRSTVDLTNSSGHLVTVTMTYPNADEARVAVLPVGATQPVSLPVGTYLRAYVGDPSTLVAERIVASTAEAWNITLGFVRTVSSAAGTTLQTGELLIAPPQGASGATYVLDRSVTSPDLVASLGLRIGTLRVGPHTLATIRCTTAAGAEREIRMTMDSTLPTEVTGAAVTSVEIGRLLDASEIGIAQRTHLVEEYRDPKHGGTVDAATGLVKTLAYRTSLTLPPSVTGVDLAPVDEDASVDLLHENEIRRATAATPARLRPNALGKVQFSTPATDLTTHALLARTNTLPAGVQLQIFPDAAVHAKLASLPEGEVARRKADLGLDGLSDDACHHVQAVLQNLASTVQQSHAPAAHGLDHQQRLGPEKMSHPHWRLTASADGSPSFEPLTPSQVEDAHAALRTSPSVMPFAATSLFGIIVHTTEKVAGDAARAATTIGHDVGQAAQKVARDASTTAASVADDLRRGDVRGALTAAARGTVSIAEDTATGVARIGGDLVDGAAHLADDLEDGAERLAVATLQLAGEVITLVLDTVEHVAQAIGHVLEQIGSSIEHALAFLANLLPLDQIFTVHDAMVASMGKESMDARMASWVTPIRTAIDGAFAKLEDQIESVRSSSHSALDAKPTAQPALAPHHSEGKDTLDWIMSHVFHPAAVPPERPTPPPALTTAHDAICSTIESHPAAGPPPPNVATRLDAIVQHGLAEPTSLGPALLDVAIDVAEGAVALLKSAVDGALDAAEHLPGAIADAVAGSVGIPVVGDLYRNRTGVAPTVLRITCLAAAVPAAFDPQSKDLPWASALTSVVGTSPAPASPASPPPPPSRDEVARAVGYVCVQVVAGLLELFPDPPPAASPPGSNVELTDLGGGTAGARDVELTGLGGDRASPSSEAAGSRDTIVAGAKFALGLMALAFSCPPGLWAARPHTLFAATGDTVGDAPNFFGDLTWTLQLVAFEIDSSVNLYAGDTEVGQALSQVVRGFSGALQLLGTVALTVADGILVDRAAAGSELARWKESGGCVLKTIHNVVAAAPDCIQLARPPATPRTMPARGIDCGLVELDAVFMTIRTAMHGLY